MLEADIFRYKAFGLNFGTVPESVSDKTCITNVLNNI